MQLLAPSIAASDLGRIREEVRDLEAAGADLIHIDIMDGAFVSNFTFGPWILEVVRSVSRLPLDCHLMVSRPREWIPILAQAGADTITVHIESTPQIHREIESIKNAGKKAGVSFNPGSPVALIEELLGWVDVVQVMGVDPGFSGQTFLSNVLPKVQRLKDIRMDGKYLIEVDGGVTAGNIAGIHAAGADIFVVGSHIFSSPDRSVAVAGLRAKLAKEEDRVGYHG